MLRTVLGLSLGLALVACSPTLHKVQLVNKTPRTIEEVFLFPQGSQQHGASRARLAPNATAEVSVPAGNVEVLAVSEKIQLDEKTREKPSASYVVELKGPVELVFHDADQPAPARSPRVHAVTFRPSAPTQPEPPADE